MGLSVKSSSESVQNLITFSSFLDVESCHFIDLVIVYVSLCEPFSVKSGGEFDQVEYQIL